MRREVRDFVTQTDSNSEMGVGAQKEVCDPTSPGPAASTAAAVILTSPQTQSSGSASRFHNSFKNLATSKQQDAVSGRRRVFVDQQQVHHQIFFDNNQRSSSVPCHRCKHITFLYRCQITRDSSKISSLKCQWMLVKIEDKRQIHLSNWESLIKTKGHDHSTLSSTLIGGAMKVSKNLASKLIKNNNSTSLEINHRRNRSTQRHGRQ